MATALTRNVLRMPGRLIMNPTANLYTYPFPYGGTELGITRDAEFRFGITKHVIRAEEWGNIPSEVIEGGSYAVMSCVLREFDNDMVSKVFINTADGNSNDKTIASGVTQTNQPGFRLASTQGFKLLFAPKAENTQLFVVMYNAVPVVDEDAMVQLSLAEEVGIAVTFMGLPEKKLTGADGRVYEIGRKESIHIS
jgi:hypothetical protein